MASYVVAGDIGGTKTNLALYHAAQPTDQKRDESLVLVREGSFPSARYPGLEEILNAFLDRQESVGAAAFGIAGPVLDGRVTATNLAWQVEATRLSSHLGGAQVRLMNDLEATAYGVLCLGPEEFQSLNPGCERRGHRAIIAAGTGLGQAFLFWDGRRYRAAATEGGHVDFAPGLPSKIACSAISAETTRMSRMNGSSPVRVWSTSGAFWSRPRAAS